jgi:N-acetylglucosamine kinase-like BadF-type ATPase
VGKEIIYNRAYFLGIDSGATSTEVLLSFPPLRKGGLRGVQKEKFFRFAPISYSLLGHEETEQRLTDIIKKSTAKIGLQNVAYIVAGISGARNEKNRDRLRKKISKNLKFKNIAIYPDTTIAFASIFRHNDTNCGILLAGTGSVLYFVNSKGKIQRIGGWGRYIGDEGSGYWIAREALSRLTQSFDRRSGKTRLENVILKNFEIDKENLIKHVYHNNFEIAKVTKLVFDCAEKGDKISIEIIKDAARHLVKHFLPLKNMRVTIALSGSLFSQEKLLERYVRRLAKEKFPNITLIKPKRKPVWGAVEMGINTIARSPSPPACCRQAFSGDLGRRSNPTNIS